MAKIKPLPRSQQKGKFWKDLNKIIDPELNVGIVDIGLIYDIKVDKNKNATVVMTLTSPTCPQAPMIIDQVETTMRKQKTLKNAYVEIVWDPPWTPDFMDPEIKKMIWF